MIHTGDCVEVMATLEAESVDAVVTDPPYGLEFMGKEWDRFATGRAAKYAKGGDLITEEQIAERRGKGGAGPSYVNRPAKRCAKCGKQAWSGSPCQCPEPEWIMDNSPLHASQAWHETWARQAFRLLKPGGYLLAFGGTRTYHRLTSAIEDAGFEIRDCLVWAYASGFPKSLDVSKAIDKAAGAERAVVGTRIRDGGPAGMTADRGWNSGPMADDDSSVIVTAPATDAAKHWQGWGTALKPAWEPIVMARKPLVGTVAQNVTRYGTGALNIDATRIEGVPRTTHTDGNHRTIPTDGWGMQPYGAKEGSSGRWPANLILTDPLFDGGVSGVVGGGTVSSGLMRAGTMESQSSPFVARAETPMAQDTYGDTGTYSRFFLIPKAARSDREPVLRGQLADRKPPGWSSGPQSPGTFQSQPTPARGNVHPTVKPVELMRHLVRLVTPPGGTVLDCFLGSGTTAIACELEGFAWIGIEREPEYVAIAEARLNGTQRGIGL